MYRRSESALNTVVSGQPLTGSHLANLHTFLIAARHLSFARAASELFLTASAVSHRIARLEESLGIKLFIRTPRAVHLTEDGERIFHVMQALMGELSMAVRGTAIAPIAGQLIVYARPSIAQSWLVPHLEDFIRQYPGIELDLRTGNETIDYRTSSIDLLISYSEGNFPGLVCEHLMDERIAPVCSPEYARRHQLDGTITRLADCTILHDVAAWENAAHDAEWRTWAEQAHAHSHLPQRSLTFDRADLCATAAIHHAGVAIGREQLVRQDIANGRLVMPFGDFISMGRRGYYLVYPEQARFPKRLEVFIQWLRNCAATSA